MNLKKEHYMLNDFSEPGPLLRRLYSIVRETLWPEMSYRFFLQFYLNSKPHSMQITFLQSEGIDVGFFTCTYAFQQLMNRNTVVCRVAIGITEKYQKKSMPFTTLCKRIIAYKLRHPFRDVYMVAYLANAFVYSAIAKYTAEFWPNPDKATPLFIRNLKENILAVGNLKKYEIRPFVLKIHFPVHLPPTLLKRIYESNDPSVKAYIDMNPDFERQFGVMTIVPVRWTNIGANIWKAMISKPLKKYEYWGRWLVETLINIFKN